MSKECLYCGKLFEKPYQCSIKNWTDPSSKNYRKCCSRECQRLYRINNPEYSAKLNFSGLEIGRKWWLGKARGIPWNKDTKGIMKPNSTSFQKGIKPWNTGLGMTSEEKLLRIRKEYKEWRMAVHLKCNFTCVLCGYKSHTRINGKSDIVADHIKPFALYPELRLDIENGRTLCISCHLKTETYGINKKYFTLKEETLCQ